MGIGNCLAFSPAQAVDKDIQRPLSGNPGVELPYRAGGGISGVSEKRQLLLGSLLIQLLEAGLGQIDLTPDLEPRRRLFGHGKRYALYRPQILGDILAAEAIAAGGADLKQAVDIGQSYRQAVDFKLADEVGLAAAQKVGSPPVPGVKLFIGRRRWPG